jgi:hypothetical protein
MNKNPAFHICVVKPRNKGQRAEFGRRPHGFRCEIFKEDSIWIKNNKMFHKWTICSKFDRPEKHPVNVYLEEQWNISEK